MKSSFYTLLKICNPLMKLTGAICPNEFQSPDFKYISIVVLVMAARITCHIDLKSEKCCNLHVHDIWIYRRTYPKIALHVWMSNATRFLKQYGINSSDHQTIQGHYWQPWKLWRRRLISNSLLCLVLAWHVGPMSATDTLISEVECYITLLEKGCYTSEWGISLAIIHILFVSEVWRQTGWQDLCFLCISGNILFNAVFW